jgi:hypothetical protein
MIERALLPVHKKSTFLIVIVAAPDFGWFLAARLRGIWAERHLHNRYRRVAAEL